MTLDDSIQGLRLRLIRRSQELGKCQLNGAVERAQHTPTEEFYEVTECAWTVEALNRELRSMGDDLQDRPPPPGPRVLDALAVPAALVYRATQAPLSVSYVLNQYSLLTERSPLSTLLASPPGARFPRHSGKEERL